MKYLAPALVLFALFSSFAKAEVPGGVITATVSKPGSPSVHLWSNAAFRTMEECKAALDNPIPRLQISMDQLRAVAKEDGATVDFACEVPTQGV